MMHWVWLRGHNNGRRTIKESKNKGLLRTHAEGLLVEMPVPEIFAMKLNKCELMYFMRFLDGELKKWHYKISLFLPRFQDSVNINTFGRFFWNLQALSPCSQHLQSC